MNNPRDKIDYTVKRSQRSTADIIVERDGNVLVRVPEELPDDRIEDLVEAKRYWIIKTLAEWRDLNVSQVAREFKGGEGFLYLGRNYRLSLVSEQDMPLLLKGGRFCLRRDLLDAERPESARKAFRDFYIQKGMQKVTERVAYFSPKVGVRPAGVVVRDLSNRWASWSPSGRVAFHWKCMMAPITIIDYIVVHELCHFHIADHSDAFWNEVDKVILNYHERKEWLRKNGAGMDL